RKQIIWKLPSICAWLLAHFIWSLLPINLMRTRLLPVLCRLHHPFIDSHEIIKPMRIPKQEFARRRKQLMAMMEPNSIAIVAGASEKLRSRDTDYPFRQDSDLFYLSGFPEPQTVLVLI